MKRRSFLALLAFVVPVAKAAAKSQPIAETAPAPSMEKVPSVILPAQIAYYDSHGVRRGFYPLFEIEPRLVRTLS